MDLFPYQQEGAAWLRTRRCALLADEMGLGKSAQAIRAADLAGADTVLVLCPAIARLNWQREWWKWSPFDRPVSVLLSSRDRAEPHGVTVCNYELLLREAVYEQLLALAPDVLILDEVHYLKSRDAQRTKKVFYRGGLVGRARRIWALSGTPMPNAPHELYPLLRVFGVVKARYESYQRRYCTGYWDGCEFRVTGGKNLQALRSLVQPVMLRRKKDDVMTELPPISWHDLVVEPSPVDVDCWFVHYLGRKPGAFEQDLEMQTRMVEHVVKTTDASKRLDALQALGGTATSTVRRYVGLAKVPMIAQLLREELDAGAIDKIVVFAIHRDVIESLRQELRDYGAVTLYGGTPAQQRQLRERRFQEDPKCRVFIANIQAAGIAINLTAAAEVLFAEASWTPTDNAQAAMRCHRIGQQRKVRVRFVGLAGSVDEKVQQVLRRKTATIAKVFD